MHNIACTIIIIADNPMEPPKAELGFSYTLHTCSLKRSYNEKVRTKRQIAMPRKTTSRNKKKLIAGSVITKTTE